MGRKKGKKTGNQGQMIPCKTHSKVKRVTGKKQCMKTKVLKGTKMEIEETLSDNVTIVNVKNGSTIETGIMSNIDDSFKERKTSDKLSTAWKTKKQTDFLVNDISEKDFVVVSDNPCIMLLEAQTEKTKTTESFGKDNKIRDTGRESMADTKTHKKNKGKRGKETNTVEFTILSKPKPDDSKIKKRDIIQKDTEKQNLMLSKQRNQPRFESEFVKKAYDRNLERERELDDEQVAIRQKMLTEMNGAVSEAKDIDMVDDVKQYEEEEEEDASDNNSSSEENEMHEMSDDVLECLERQEALFKVFGHDQTDLGSCGTFGDGASTFQFHGQESPKTVNSMSNLNDSGFSNDNNRSRKDNVGKKNDKRSTLVRDGSLTRQKKRQKKNSVSERGEQSQSSVKLRSENSDEIDEPTGEFDDGRIRCVSLSLPRQEAAIVLLAHPQELCIQGKAVVTMVTGRMEIMGHKLELDKTYKVFSPLSNSYTVLKTIEGSSNFKDMAKKVAKLLEVKKSENGLSELEPFQKEHCVSFVVRPLDLEAHTYISSMSPFNGLFSIRSNEPLPHNTQLLPLGVGLFPREYVMRPWITLSKDIRQILDLWENLLSRGDKSGTGRAPVLLVCGGKNCGKSTLNRHLLNSALNCVKGVSYLELDVGQTEFSPPGCVSLYNVTEPVLGPPFSHLRTAKRMCFYGGVNAGANVSLYTKCVEYVFAEHKGDNPLIVNTMGWNKGVGLKLFVDVLHITNPDVVVQINSYKSTDNFPQVTPYFKMAETGWLYNRHNQRTMLDEEELAADGHELCLVQTPVRKMQEKFITWTAADHRNVTLLSYFCNGLLPGQTLLSLAPVTVPWTSVAVHICNGRGITSSQTLLVLNGSIVGLCQAELPGTDTDTDGSHPRLLSDFPLCNCLGFGLVRGIDPATKLLYIVTPLTLNDLATVNVLVKGTITLPEQVSKHQKTVGPKPYWDTLSRSVGSWKTRYKERKMRRPGAAFRSRNQ